MCSQPTHGNLLATHVAQLCYLSPPGLLLSRRRAFVELAPLLPAAWALLARLDAPQQRRLARGGRAVAAAAAAETAKEAVEESVVLLAAQRLACAAPFLAAALLRWVVAHAQLEVLEREIAQQVEQVVAAKASCHKRVLYRAGAAVVLEQRGELSTVSGLDAVLGFLTEEVGTWRPLHRASSPSPSPSLPPSPVRLGRADDADANAADADAADADDADADAAPPRTGGRGAGTSTSHRLSITAREEAAAAAAAAAQDAQLAEVFRQLGAEAATRPSLGALRPSEREGPLWLSGDPVWAVLRGGLLGLFRTPNGHAPEDLAARCALRLDLRRERPGPPATTPVPAIYHPQVLAAARLATRGGRARRPRSRPRSRFQPRARCVAARRRACRRARAGRRRRLAHGRGGGQLGGWLSGR